MTLSPEIQKIVDGFWARPELADRSYYADKKDGESLISRVLSAGKKSAEEYAMLRIMCGVRLTVILICVCGLFSVAEARTVVVTDLAIFLCPRLIL